MSNSSDWIDIEKKYYAQTVRRQPVVIVRGDGTEVWDADGWCSSATAARRPSRAP